MGSTCQVGLDGTGKSTSIKLAADLAGCALFSLTINKGYNESDFRDDLKEVLKLTGIENVNVVFLLTDADIVKVFDFCFVVSRCNVRFCILGDAIWKRSPVRVILVDPSPHPTAGPGNPWYEVTVTKCVPIWHLHSSCAKGVHRPLCRVSLFPQESFLEDVNCVLNSGEVPDLFDKDEVDALVTELKNSSLGEDFPDARDDLFRLFLQVTFIGGK